MVPLLGYPLLFHGRPSSSVLRQGFGTPKAFIFTSLLFTLGSSSPKWKQLKFGGIRGDLDPREGPSSITRRQLCSAGTNRADQFLKMWLLISTLLRVIPNFHPCRMNSSKNGTLFYLRMETSGLRVLPNCPTPLGK